MKFYTIWLALVCVLVFILQISLNGFSELFLLNQDSYIQPWRFLTSIFLHGSLIHLIYNLFALVMFGFILERIIGSRNFLLVFLVSGILGNLFSVNFYSSSLGASGAIFGIIGALTLLRPFMAVWAYSLPMPMILASILWVIGDVLGVFGYGASGIGNLAHLSGLAIGLVFGMIFFKEYREKTSKKEKIWIDESNIRRWEKVYLER